MSAIADKTCPACKRPHVLYLADADRPAPGREVFLHLPRRRDRGAMGRSGRRVEAGRGEARRRGHHAADGLVSSGGKWRSRKQVTVSTGAASQAQEQCRMQFAQRVQNSGQQSHGSDEWPKRRSQH